MARRRRASIKRRRRSYSRPFARKHKDRTIRILPTLGIANYLIQVGTSGGKISKLQAGDIGGYTDWALKDAILYGTGYDIVGKTWRAEDFMRGTGIIIVAAIASKAMDKLGVNRYMSKIPMIGKWVKL